jgi:hypothetical protein
MLIRLLMPSGVREQNELLAVWGARLTDRRQEAHAFEPFLGCEIDLAGKRV